MDVERRGFNSSTWVTSYNQFYGPPGDSFRFIDPFMPNRSTPGEHSTVAANAENPRSNEQIPLVDCAVSHAARCILSTANAIDMGKAGLPYNYTKKISTLFKKGAFFRRAYRNVFRPQH